MKLEIGGKVYEVEVVDVEYGVQRVTVDGTVYEVRLPDLGSPAEAPAPEPARPRQADRAQPEPSEGAVLAPLPGSVTSVEVSEGDEVEEGQTVLVLESMKMSVPVKAPRAGRVRSIRATVGESLQAGQAIMEIE
jgi:biotin carboxyl carrier protein